MAFEPTVCTETVTLLRALTLGAGQACVSMGTGSILTLVAGFVLAVVALQFGANRLLGALKAPKRAPPPAPAPQDSLSGPGYDGGPIKTTGAWRG